MKNDEKINNPVKSALEKSSALKRIALRLLEPLIYSNYFSKLMDRVIERHQTGEDALDATLSEMDVRYTIRHGDLTRIPKDGPTVVVSNHPFGCVEAFVLSQILRGVRPDVKMLANYLLSLYPLTKQYCIFVDPFGSSDARKKNIVAIKDAISWVKSGKLLGIFPSGTVSHIQFPECQVSDPLWQPSVASIIKKSKATVVPIYVNGDNGWLFLLAGLLHPRLRTLLLPRAFRKQVGQQISLAVGRPIPYSKLEDFSTNEEIMEYLRLRTYILGKVDLVAEEKNKSVSGRPRKARKMEPLASPEPLSIVRNEVEALPAANKLYEHGTYQVFQATSDLIPHTLREIGRLREQTYRGVNEGSGKALDIDTFDNFYRQLFVWNSEKHEVVGAYRMVETDKVLKQHGTSGFYSNTLFHYKASLIEELGPALELGRSFVRQEYQKDYMPLLLLWRGIGSFVALHPQYKVLFGLVSINTEYDSISRDLIVSFLQQHQFLPNLSGAFRPRNPHRSQHVRRISKKFTQVVRNLGDVSDLLQEIEATHSKVPVLLRQYLKLNAKLLGFNIDPDFGDVIDGLIYVDLTEVEPRLLEHYMGKEQTACFFSHHKRAQQPEAS